MSFDSDLKALLIKHEGRKSRPYVDSVGKITIGIGHNLTDNDLPEFVIDDLYDVDIGEAKSNLYHIFADFDEFSRRRKMALCDLIFNLGMIRFRGFKKMVQAIQEDRWDDAGNEVLDSKYAKQVGYRAVEIAEMLREG